MAFADLKTQMDQIVVRTEKRLLLVTQAAIKNMIIDAQTTKNEGGKMPVDTGFLRATGISSVNVPPSGPIRGEKKKKYTWNGESMVLTFSKFKIGDVFYFGWSAIYARKQNARHGFLDSAIMKWQSFVDAEIAYYRKKDGK